MKIVAIVDAGDARTERLLAVLGAKADVQTAGSGGEGEQLARTAGPDVVVFDPAVTGEDFVARIRRADPGQKVVAWLPAGGSAAAAEALESGADEALDAAMAERELAARLVLAARRGTDGATAVTLGDLHVDAAQGEARWRDADVPLSRREREVLHVLAEAGGRPVRREVLYRRVWGYAMARGDRSVDVNVKRLRAKLAAAAGDGIEITTVPGVGYRLDVTGL